MLIRKNWIWTVSFVIWANITLVEVSIIQQRSFGVPITGPNKSLGHPSLLNTVSCGLTHLIVLQVLPNTFIFISAIMGKVFGMVQAISFTRNALGLLIMCMGVRGGEKNLTSSSFQPWKEQNSYIETVFNRFPCAKQCHVSD